MREGLVELVGWVGLVRRDSALGPADHVERVQHVGFVIACLGDEPAVRPVGDSEGLANAVVDAERPVFTRERDELIPRQRGERQRELAGVEGEVGSEHALEFRRVAGGVGQCVFSERHHVGHCGHLLGAQDAETPVRVAHGVEVLDGQLATDRRLHDREPRLYAGVDEGEQIEVRSLDTGDRVAGRLIRHRCGVAQLGAAALFRLQLVEDGQRLGLGVEVDDQLPGSVHSPPCDVETLRLESTGVRGRRTAQGEPCSARHQQFHAHALVPIRSWVGCEPLLGACRNASAVDDLHVG